MMRLEKERANTERVRSPKPIEAARKLAVSPMHLQYLLNAS